MEALVTCVECRAGGLASELWIDFQVLGPGYAPAECKLSSMLPRSACHILRTAYLSMSLDVFR